MPSATPVCLPDLYGKSVFLHLLYNRLGRVLTVPGACLLWAILTTGLFAALGWTAGTLMPGDRRGELSLLQDTTALSYCLLLPLCFLLLHSSLLRFQRYLNRLDEVLEAASPPEAHDELLGIARSTFTAQGMRRVRLLLVAGGLVIFAYNVVTNLFPGYFYSRSEKWDGIAYPVTFAVSRLYVLFVWGYAIPVWASGVYAQLAVMVRINRRMAAQGWLRISPLAPDGFGGLSQLSRAASGIGYLILAAGLFFLAPLLRSVVWGLPLHVGNYVGLGLYALLAFVGALVPVYLLHRILDQRKAAMLSFFNGAFDAINSRVMALVRQNNVKGLGEEDLGRALMAVDRLHSHWAALPVWPLGLAFFVKVLVTVVSPIAVFLAQQFTSQLPF